MKSCAWAVAEVDPKIVPPGGTAELNTVWKVRMSRGVSRTSLVAEYRIGNGVPYILIVNLTANVTPAQLCESGQSKRPKTPNSEK
jgi:hypothetical protein